MAWRFHGRAKVSASAPQAFGVCDRCANWYNLVDLSWQYDYRGPLLQNLRIRVCDRCLDEPQQQLKPIITGPDPLPVLDPRPEFFSALEDGPFWSTDNVNIVDDENGDEIVTFPYPNNT